MESLVHNFISNFFGYGNPNSEICLVGIKERGDGTNEDTIARINAWAYCNQSSVIDALSFVSKYDTLNPRVPTLKELCMSNRTWGRIQSLKNNIYGGNGNIFTTLSTLGNMCNINIQGIPRESIKSTSEFASSINLFKSLISLFND